MEPLFLVFATHNPIEQEGTYPLPEAQLDRFIFEVEVDHASTVDEEAIVRTTTGADEPWLAKVLGLRIERLRASLRDGTAG